MKTEELRQKLGISPNMPAREQRARIYARDEELQGIAVTRDLTPEEREEVRALERLYEQTSINDPIKPEPESQYRDSVKDEKRVDLLTREQRMGDYVRKEHGIRAEEEGLSFGRYVRGLVTGDWLGAERERRALAEGTLASGGYTVPTPLALQIIDRARNSARVFEAGAVTVPMNSQKLKMARVAGDPTANWKAENAAATESDMTFEVVEFTAKTLIALVRSSRELIEDSVNVEDTLMNAFAKALALELDRAALRGSGTDPEPRGVRNTTGVAVNSLGTNGAQPTYENLVDYALGPVEDENFDPNAIIWAPRTGRTFAKYKSSDGTFLLGPRAIEEIPKLATNAVSKNLTHGTATNASEIYSGQWNQLMVGVRHQLEIDILKERYAENYQFGFLAHLRADVQLAQPKAFAVVTGVIP